MTMTETPETPKPAKQRRPRKRRTAVAAAPKPVPAEFAGLTPVDCCDACNENRCVISGINVCSHPLKGGLQGGQMGQVEVVKRFNRAKRVLAGQKINVD